MFCSNCGSETSRDNLFCTNCGEKITLPASTSLDPPSLASQMPNPPSANSSQQAPVPSPEMSSAYATSNVNKKNRKLLIIFIIVGVVLVVAISVLTILYFNKRNNSSYGREEDNKSSMSITREESLEVDDELADNTIDNIVDLFNDIFDDYIDDDISDEYNIESDYDETDMSIEDGSSTDDTASRESTNEERYTYSELPDVLSIDSDSRFSYYDYFTLNNSSIYSFEFIDANATEDDLVKACEDYSLFLQEQYGFTYMKDVSEQNYAESGRLNYYLLKDNIEFGIVPSNEEGYYFAYINILFYDIDTDGIELEMPIYDYFLADRQVVYFTLNETVNMDNGLSFYVYEVMGNYTEDGDTVIDVVMDISSYYSDFYINNGDFLLLPLDAEGNALSDAVPINIVYDEAGNEEPMPFLLSASSYYTYTFYYPVPAETMSLLLYATNVLGDDYSYPAYVMRIGD